MTLLSSHNPVKKTRRYDFASLAKLMGQTEHGTAAALGVSGSTMVQYREQGMTERVADRLAVKAGFTPYEVWPDLLDAQIDDEAAKRRALIAARRRESRRRAPAEVRERERGYARRYRAEAAAAVAMKQRQWREEHAEQIRDYDRAYREANRERIRQRQRDYYRANAERMRANQRERDLRRRAKKAAW